MTICVKHVHRLEVQKFVNFCAARLPARLDIETKFLILDNHVKKRNTFFYIKRYI